MYRIELAPGEEALFKSIDEMAAGIANGVIKSNARIWHQTSAKWLPIEFHPHYKIALTKGPQSAPRAEYREPPAVAGPAAMSVPPIFDQTTPRSIFEPPVPAPIFERPAPAPAPIFERPTPAPTPIFERPTPAPYAAEASAPSAHVVTLDEPSSDPEDLGDAYIEINPPRGRGRTWTVGAAAAAAIVVLGGGAAFSAFRSSRTPSQRPVRTVTPPPAPASYGAQPVVMPATPWFGSRTSRPATARRRPISVRTGSLPDSGSLRVTRSIAWMPLVPS